MARDPAPGGAFVFDLVDDEAADVDTPVTGTGAEAQGDPDDDGPGPGEPPSSGRDRRLPPAVAPVAGLLAILLGTGFAVDGVRDGARMERMREVHGGVVDVSSPLEVTWEWRGAVGPPGPVEGGAWNEVAVLGDLLTFQSRGDLVALDPATGDEAWRIELGEDPDCGPVGSPGWSEAVTQRVVCLSGSDTDREVVTVGPDGVAAAGRDLDAADVGRYGEARPGPDGTVLRAQRVGPGRTADVDGAECSDVGVCTGTVRTGQDLRLRAEDARTGAERWIVTVPFRPTSADQCTNWYATSWDGSGELVGLGGMLDAEDFGARITGDLVQFSGCGVSAAVTPGGALLEAEGVAWSGMTVGLGGGGYAMVTPRGSGEAMAHTTLFAADGTVVGEIPEYASGPRTTDEPEGTTLLTSGPSGGHLRSYTTDGSLRWEVAELQSGPPEFLAQVDGTLVTSSWTSGFRGLDLATGAERWTLGAGEAMGDPSYDLGYVSQVFTDGRSVLLPLQSELGAVELVAVDVTSGELGWNRPLADLVGAEQNAFLVAVDGRLLAIRPDGVRGLG